MLRTVTRLTLLASILALATTTQAALIHRYSFTDGAKDSAPAGTVAKVDGALKGAAAVADGKLTLANGEKSSGESGIACVEFPAAILPEKGSATIAIWFTAKDTGGFARLLDIGHSEGGDGSAFFYLSPRTGDDTARAAISATDTGSKSNVDTTARLDDGKPHLITVVIDGTAKKLHLYVDGKEAGTAADLGDNTLDKVKQSHRYIGRSGFDVDPALSGSIDELRIYDEALTAEQVSNLNGAGPDTVPPAGPKDAAPAK